MNPDRAIALILGAVARRRARARRVAAAARPQRTASRRRPRRRRRRRRRRPSAPTATPARGRGRRARISAGRDRGRRSVVRHHRGSERGEPVVSPGTDIPGLGEVTAIEEDRITLAGSDGTLVLQLAPAPTTTPTLRRAESAESSTPSAVYAGAAAAARPVRVRIIALRRAGSIGFLKITLSSPSRRLRLMTWSRS